MAPFALSAQLSAHSDDIKCVLPVNDDILLSASRDKTVGVWHRRADDKRQFALNRILAGHEGYVNALEVIPSDEACSLDLIVSAGTTGVVLLHQLDKDLESDAESSSLEPLEALQGHHANICALTYSAKRRKLLSASWDCAARVWSRERQESDSYSGIAEPEVKSKAGGWRCEAVLSGHNAAVWGVAVIENGPNEGCYLTGAADSLVKAWDTDGQLLRTFPKFPDMVRSLAMLPSGEKFALASNDGSVRIANLKGKVTETLGGHEDYVYHVSASSDGTLLSCGEDHTLRIWSSKPSTPERSAFDDATASLHYGLEQTLLHPCQTVWCGSWLPNGDIVSGGSDNVIRIWTTDDSRRANPAEVKVYDAAMQDVMRRKRNPAPAGTRDATARLEEMTLDIDLEDDKPPLQLKFTRASDPEAVAAAFSREHGLSDTYRKQIEEFLASQTAS